MATKKKDRLMGLAFVIQFVTSFTAGVFIRPLWLVEGDMAATLTKIAGNPTVFTIGMFLDVLTALGVVLLGAALFRTLKGIGPSLSTAAFGIYGVEAGMIAISKMESYKLLHISQASTGAWTEAQLETATMSFEAMEYMGSTLHMLAFCMGALIFYSLLVRSDVVPKWMSLWGLVTLMPLILGTFTQIFGVSIHFAFYVPYIPFELVIGLYCLIHGVAVVPGEEESVEAIELPVD